MNLNEAFKALDSLNEDIFDMSDNGLSGLSDFMNDDIESEDVQIIDPEATTEDELADSYVGKVILDCSVCHSKIYKNKDEVTLDEEGVLANVGEDCPYCYTSDGFKVVGEVVPFDGEGNSDDDDDVDEGLLAGDVNVNLDARGFGGKDNNVSVLGGKLPMGESLNEGLLLEGALSDMVKKAATRVGADASTILRCFGEIIGGKAEDITTHIENKAVLKALQSGNKSVMNGLTQEDVEELVQDIADYENKKSGNSDDLDEGIFDKFGRGRRGKATPTSDEDLYDDVMSGGSYSSAEDADDWYGEVMGRPNRRSTNRNGGRFATGQEPKNYGSMKRFSVDPVSEGIFDGKATKEKNYKAAIKKAFEKDFVIVAQEISGLAQTLASHAIDSSATTEQNAKKIQPMLANIEGAIKKPRNFDVISTLMNYGRKYADDDVTVEKLKEYFDASMRLRRTEKIGQKAYEYFQMKLADAVLKKLSSFRKYLKKEYGESYDRQVNENIQDLSMTANDTHFEVSEDESGTVTVTASPATANGGEQIAPVSDELEGEITSASEDGEDGTGEEDSIDIAIDEVDEGSLDELGEAYLTNVYGNVKSFKTDNVSTCGNKFIVEGTISFSTGKRAKTSFILESHSADRKGNVSFVGGNAHFSDRRNAYTLNGSVVRGKFIAESLDYNYMAVNGKNKVGVKGTATKKVQ